MKERRHHYWIVANLEGHTYLIYGGINEEEANQRGIEKLGVQFKVVKLPTSDVGAASRMLKGNTLEETGDLKQSVKRLKHKRRR